MCKVEKCRAINVLGKRVGNCVLSDEIDVALLTAAYEVGQKTGTEIHRGVAYMLSASITAGCLYAKELSDELMMQSKKAQSDPQIRRQSTSGNN